MNEAQLIKNLNTHDWIIGWQESDKPHPGFGGSQNIFGCYANQCSICGMYLHEFDSKGKYAGQACGVVIRLL